MPNDAPPATVQIPLISGRVTGPLGIGHLPRLWLKMRLKPLGLLPEGYRCGEGGSDGAIIEAFGLDRDTFVDYVATERPDYVTFETWIRANAVTASPQIDELHASFETLHMPEPRRSLWTERFGLPDYSIATRLNELDDWDLVHAQIIAPDAPKTDIVPAISSSVTGPVGVVHLPRLWLKMLLHAAGRLPEGYRYGIGGFDEMVEEHLGIGFESLAAFIGDRRPGYLELETWVREHATNLTPESIAAHNATLMGFIVPEERAAGRRAEYGVDATVRTGVALNDLDDWLVMHRRLIAL